VNTHMYGQLGWTNKHLLANIAFMLLRSLSLRSFPNSHLFFSYLFVHLIIIIIRGILKHNTRSSSSSRNSRASRSSLSLATTTVLAFSARFGCGFFCRTICVSLVFLVRLSLVASVRCA